MAEHPITPPPELVQQWIKKCDNPEEPRWQEYEQDIANQAARWVPTRSWRRVLWRLEMEQVVFTLTKLGSEYF